MSLPGAPVLDQVGPTVAHPRRRPEHPVLWLAAIAALAPVVVPFLFLIGRALGGGSRALETIVSGRTLELVADTAALVAAVSASAAVIGVGAAWLTEHTDLRGRRWWRVAVALPLVLPSYVIALALLSAFGARGLIAEAIGIGLPSLRGFWGAYWALTAATYPFVYLITAAAIRRIDPALEEAARGLGASPRAAFRRVVLPQLREAIGAGVLLSALYSLSDFGAVSLAGYDSFTRVVYAQYAGRLDRTPAIVLAAMLVLLALAVLWIEGWSRRGRSLAARPVVHAPTLSTLGRRRQVVAATALGTLVTAALGLPISALGAWMARDPFPEGVPWGSLTGSVSVSALAAIAAAALSIPVAILVVRHGAGRTRLVERLSYLAYSVPHITVGLAMVFVSSRWLGPLYQSIVVLLGVYVSVFFAQALGSVRSSLSQVSPTLEEAARTLGKTPLQILWRVVLPLIRSGVAAGALLVFLTTMKELPITLLLRPTGLDTLAVDVWSASSELLYSTAAVPALLLLAISAVPTFVLATRQR